MAISQNLGSLSRDSDSRCKESKGHIAQVGGKGHGQTLEAALLGGRSHLALPGWSCQAEK